MNGVQINKKQANRIFIIFKIYPAKMMINFLLIFCYSVVPTVPKRLKLALSL